MRLALQLRQKFSKATLSGFDQPSFSHLPSRKLIIVYGPQSRKLLQGLTTNNLNYLFQSPSKQGKRKAQYTYFLDPKGKVITDAILIRPQKINNGVIRACDDQIWIDVAGETQFGLLEHLKRYTWKKKVEIVDLAFQEDAPEVLVGFNRVLPKGFDNVEEFKGKAGMEFVVEPDQYRKDQVDGGYVNLAFFDPRGIKFGLRMISGPGQFQFKGPHKKSTQSEYSRIETMFGVSKPQTMRTKLPFMFNSDLFNGFAFNKGCYLGQELVARAYHTGIVRRRIFPYVLDDCTRELPVGTNLVGEGNEDLGKVLESYPGYGTVLCSYLPLMEKKWPLKLGGNEQGELKMPFSMELNHYLAEMKKKQNKLQQIDL